MNDNNYIDDQTLGAYIDGELDVSHRAGIIEAMETDAGLRDRIYQLRRARDLLRLAYADARPAPADKRITQNNSWRLCSTRLVASLALLTISFTAGIISQRQLDSPAPNTESHIAGQLQQQSEKIMLHLSQSDPEQFLQALDYTERFLKAGKANGSQIEVVAHASGLDLMRADASPLKDRLITMMQQYDNVHFVACANAIRLLRDKGVEPVIIKGVSTENTAFDHIIGRLQSGGWQYVKVENLTRI